MEKKEQEMERKWRRTITSKKKDVMEVKRERAGRSKEKERGEGRES